VAMAAEAGGAPPHQGRGGEGPPRCDRRLHHAESGPAADVRDRLSRGHPECLPVLLGQIDGKKIDFDLVTARPPREGPLPGIHLRAEAGLRMRPATGTCGTRSTQGESRHEVRYRGEDRPSQPLGFTVRAPHGCRVEGSHREGDRSRSPSGRVFPDHVLSISPPQRRPAGEGPLRLGFLRLGPTMKDESISPTRRGAYAVDLKMGEGGGEGLLVGHENLVPGSWPRPGTGCAPA